MTQLDPSHLPGNYRTRVFVGGSYLPGSRQILALIEAAVRESGFVPILADHYDLLKPNRDVHDVTLYLLHSCRLAVFDLSTLSGALMEVERCSDYNLARALILYQHPFNEAWPANSSAWKTSAMLKSLVTERRDMFKVKPYVRPIDSAVRTKQFLRTIRRSLYGKLHDL